MRVKYDPAVHVQNARGRWIDRHTKRLVGLDPSTVPGAAAAPPAPVEGPARDLGDVPLPPAAAAPVEPVTEPAPEPSPGPGQERPLDPIGGGQQGASGAPDAPLWDALPEIGAEGPGEGAGLHSHPHIEGCWRGQSEGRLCACGAKVYDPPPPEEIAAAVTFHEMALNGFVPYPRTYSTEERAALGDAIRLVSIRYGNPLARWTPIVSLLGATAMLTQARVAPPPAQESTGLH